MMGVRRMEIAMKKVIHMISSMNMGGAETMVKDYALLMDKTQFDTMIISLDKRYHSVNEKYLQDAGIPVIYLSELRYPAEKELNIFQKIIRRIARYYDLWKIIKKEKPDILHVHLYIGNYLKLIPVKKWGIKLLYTVHNVPERFFDPLGKNKEKYFAYKEIKRLLKKEDLTLISLHDDMNQELRKIFSTDRVITVNNGINLDRFHKELYNRTEIRKHLGIKKDAFVIGHVGRFHEQKNHELLIKIFHGLLKRKANAHLLLIGEGPLREQANEQIRSLGLEKYVTILQNRNDIPELMSIMDSFVFPSRWEGFGNVLIEAQSMELPCIVSDKISQSAIVNCNVLVLSLDTEVEKWVDAILYQTKAEPSEDLQKYNMRSSVKKLERIYTDKEN